MLYLFFFINYLFRFPWYDNMTVVVVTISLMVFNMAKAPSAAGENNPIGLILCIVSLLLDGITGPKQDAALRKNQHLSSTHVMVLQNIFTSFSALLAFFILELPYRTNPIKFFSNSPGSILPFMLTSFCGAIGQVYIYKALVTLGSLPLSLITTLRKFLTVFVSIIIYKHTLSTTQWLSVFAVFSALSVQIVAKHKAKSSKRKIDQSRNK